MHCTQNYLRFAISGFPKGALNSVEGLSWPENVKCGCGSTRVPSLPLNSGCSKFCIASGWGLQKPTLQVWPPTSLLPLPACTLHLREVLVTASPLAVILYPFLAPKHKGFCGGLRKQGDDLIGICLSVEAGLMHIAYVLEYSVG